MKVNDIAHELVMPATISQVIKFVCNPAYPSIVFSQRHNTTLATQYRRS